jgi:hypothetical protein
VGAAMDVALSTFGFKTSAQLPGGDLFLLPQAIRMTVASTPVETAQFFIVGSSSFGASSAQLGGFGAAGSRGSFILKPELAPPAGRMHRSPAGRELHRRTWRQCHG